MLWDPAKHLGFDFETSGVVPEYALQPWRIRQGKAWATSLVWILHADGASRGGLRPTADDMREMLEHAIANDMRIVGWNVVYDIQILLAYGFEDLVFRAKWLDGMLLWRHATIEPEYDATKWTDKKSYSLKEYVREFRPELAGYEEDIDFHSTDPQELAKLHAYNEVDVASTLHGAEYWWNRLTTRQQRVALIEAECLPLVARANLNGLPVDTLAAHELGTRLDTSMSDNLTRLTVLGATEKVIASPIQLAKLLFDDWGFTPLKHNVSKLTGKTSRSTDKEVLHELALEGDPRVIAIREVREAKGNLTKFVTAPLESVAYNEDGCTHPEARVYGTYCVPGDVEVLTPEGWQRLDHWQGGEIMQVSPDLSMRFEHADRHDAGVVDEWIVMPALQCMFTRQHTMAYLGQKTFEWRVQKAERWLDRGEAKYVPVAGHADLTGVYTANQMRLFAAVQADGSFVSKRYRGRAYASDLRFTFKKQRKIDRLCWLLDELGIRYHRYIAPTYPDRTEIHIARGSLPAWLDAQKKMLGPWLLATSHAGLRAFVDEVVHWDGSPHRDGGVTYASSIQRNREWVATAAALVGYKATVHRGNSVHISHEAAHRTVLPKQNSVVHTPRTAYCPVTRTGFWLARSNGRIFITGNSGRLTYSSFQGRNKDKRQTGFAIHQGKRDPNYRRVLTCPPGYTLVEFDAAGQEFRWMAIASGDQTMLALCQPGEDPHAFMGSRIGNIDYEQMKKDLHSKDTAVVSIVKPLRQSGKVGNLSLQYRTSYKKLRSVARVQHNIPMTEAEAEHIWRVYRKTYKGVPRYWEEQIMLTQKLGYVETLAGRRVQVVGNWKGPNGWSMGSTSINYRIQGTGADQKYLALMVLKSYMRSIGAVFAWDLHDGIYWFVPDAVVPKVAREAKYLLDHLPYKKAWGFTPPIPMTWDCKAGPNWGDLKEWEHD